MNIKTSFNILIVDDTVNNLQLLCQLLQDNPSYMLNVARSGDEALKMTNNNDFDLILLDIQMPGMNGFEACAKLKADPLKKHIPIIFLTAQTDKETTIKGFELGAVDFITKPFNSTELKIRIQTHLDLKSHRDNLEKLVAQRTVELQKALEQVNSDNKVKEEFLSTITHEMLTPLNGIKGMANLLLSTPLNSEQDSYLHLLSDSGNNLQEIVEDILDFTMISSGDIDMTITEVNPRHFLEESCQVSKMQAEEKDLSFNFNFCDNLPSTVHCNAYIINKAIVQLLSNALKFTLEGSITIAAYTETNGNDNFLVVQITDSGIGFSCDNYQNIFKKFTQLDSGQNRKFEGTGMGLTICKDLLKLIKGEITVKSEEGKGSCFSLRAMIR